MQGRSLLASKSLNKEWKTQRNKIARAKNKQVVTWQWEEERRSETDCKSALIMLQPLLMLINKNVS
jgi:hypothetical protein